MKKVHLLYSNLKTDGNELAFIFPLLFHGKLLRRDYSISVDLFDRVGPDLFDCDVLIVSSWYFGRKVKAWLHDKEQIFRFLTEAKTKIDMLIWADIADSTGTTQFEVLPFVDKYLKGQVLKNRDDYLKHWYGGRIFTDFYHRSFGVEDSEPVESHLNHIPGASELSKIHVSWNTGLATYTHWGPYYNVINYKYFDLKLPLFLPIKWTSPNDARPTSFSCRIGSSYPRASVAFQRKEVKTRLASICETTKLSRKDYFQELRRSSVSISPFGLGEISLRDYEIIVSGSLILKPNCDHMETWPDLFVQNETYLDFKWDFTDFLNEIDNIASKKHVIRDMAANAQNRYFRILKTTEGHREFCERFQSLIR